MKNLNVIPSAERQPSPSKNSIMVFSKNNNCLENKKRKKLKWDKYSGSYWIRDKIPKLS